MAENRGIWVRWDASVVASMTDLARKELKYALRDPRVVLFSDSNVGLLYRTGDAVVARDLACKWSRLRLGLGGGREASLGVCVFSPSAIARGASLPEIALPVTAASSGVIPTVRAPEVRAVTLACLLYTSPSPRD